MNSTAAETKTESTESRPEVMEFIGDPGHLGSALPNQPEARLARRGGVQDVEWHGRRQNCIVNVSVKARLAWIRNGGADWRLGLLVTTTGDIHNPHVVQSINVPFSVDALVDGVQSDNIPHDLFAPAVFDLRGSDQWYTWYDEADDVAPEDLADPGRISLEINI